MNGVPVSIQFRPRGRWHNGLEIKRTDEYVEVVVDGKRHLLAPEKVKPRKKGYVG